MIWVCDLGKQASLPIYLPCDLYICFFFFAAIPFGTQQKQIKSGVGSFKSA